jgi:hypothetical protein
MPEQVAKSSTDWIGLIMASNEAAMQWYSLATQKPLPTSGNVITLGPGGMSVGSNANWLVLGGLIIVAFIVFRK